MICYSKHQVDLIYDESRNTVTDHSPLVLQPFRSLWKLKQLFIQIVQINMLTGLLASITFKIINQSKYALRI